VTEEPEAATGGDAKQRIAAFMTGFTAETTPGSAAKIPDYREHLRPGTVVYITFLPGSDFDDTIAIAKRLKSEGFLPAPHFAARSIPSAAFLDDKLARLAGEVGLERVLVIGGALDEPVGDFTDTMQLLETGLFDKHGIRKPSSAWSPSSASRPVRSLPGTGASRPRATGCRSMSGCPAWPPSRPCSPTPRPAASARP
jgi:methylenetetrahydrofolate reductase (NADPH)